MIKKSIHIFFALLTAILIASAGVLPHHHHQDGAICFSLTHHHDSDGKSAHHEDNCPLENEVLASSSLAAHSHDHKCAFCADTDNDFHSLVHSPLLALGDQSAHYQIILEARRWNFPHQQPSCSLSISLLGAPLRAPPIA
ncbi:MAG: hypothetical protein RRY42_00750 [Mucinivorans sp.]